jgi:FkbM family methyltransferase
MKLKEFFFLLGMRPKPRVYGYKINTFDLAEYGKVDYAQWLHPSEQQQILSLAAVHQISKFLSPGDVAIDIGAHTGDTTIEIALSVGKSGCVFALEPNQYVFPVLKKNSELNRDKTNIVPSMFAATSENGEYEFEYSDAGFCNGGLYPGISKWKHGHAFKLKVEGKNLQSFLSNHYPDVVNRLRYIKVDTEGNDFEVLQSLSSLIREQKPFIKAEVFKMTSLEQRNNLLQFLKDHEYRVHLIESDSNYLGDLVTDENLMNWLHYDIFCVPRSRVVES